MQISLEFLYHDSPLRGDSAKPMGPIINFQIFLFLIPAIIPHVTKIFVNRSEKSNVL